jgi:predicted TIM-barrel fold metal-dependent hydrolase
MLDPDKRFAAMRAEGIAGECIFPGIGLYVWMLEDPDGGKASCRIYNEWIHDTLQSRSDRFRCAGLVPTWRVEDAVAEIELIADLGLGAVMMPTVAPTPYNHRMWDPVWATVEETGLPIVMHQGSGHSMIFYRGPGATIANLVSTQTMGTRTAAMLSTSGILERHPRLHVVFVEYNAGWIAPLMDTIDYYNVAFANYTTMTQGSAGTSRDGKPVRPVIYPDLAEPPSFYIKRQIHATFQRDAVAIHNVPITGPQCLMWGSDFPHEEGTFPHSAEVVDELAAGIDDDTAAAVFRNNAIEVFRFDSELMATLP